jgi:signal transduction histidine kinase
MATLILLGAYILEPKRFGPGVVRVDRATLIGPQGEIGDEVPLRHLLDGQPARHLSQRYRVELPAGLDRSRPLAAYMPGASAHTEVFVGATRIYASTRSGDRLETQFSRPQFVQLPHPLSERTRNLEVVMRSDPGGAVVFNRFWVGPLHSLGPAYEKRYFLRYEGAAAMTLFLLIAGMTSLAFWLADRSYRSPLWFGVFCILNGIAIKIGLNTTSPLLPPAQILHVAIFIVNLSFVALAQFIFEKTDNRSRAHDRLLLGYVALTIVLLLALYEDAQPYFRYALVMDAFAIALGAYLLWVLVRTWWRKRDSISRLLLGGVGLTLLLGGYSVYENWRPGSQEDAYEVLYAPLPLIVAMGWAICRRYARSSLRWRALNRRLAERVRRRESEIARAYEQLATLEKDKAIQAERERFMRDMHDGLGTQLITSLRMAERGALGQAQMQELLTECLDELHFAIQSLKTAGDDLFIALADYRYRLEPRLHAGGIELQWRVAPTPRLRLNTGAVMQILRIVNEAVGNAVKHSGAPTIAIEGVAEGDDYVLTVRDRGRGFAPTQRRGNGLDSMRARAASIGAELSIAEDGGCLVRLAIPLSRLKAMQF